MITELFPVPFAPRPVSPQAETSTETSTESSTETSTETLPKPPSRLSPKYRNVTLYEMWCQASDRCCLSKHRSETFSPHIRRLNAEN